MALPILLGIAALAAIAMGSDSKTPAPGAAPAGPGAGGSPSETGLLGVENVGGVLRYRPDVAQSLLAGALAQYTLGPGSGNGERRPLIQGVGGSDNASVWAVTYCGYGRAILINADGRVPGELWAVPPEQVPALANAGAGQWAVLLYPSNYASKALVAPQAPAPAAPDPRALGAIVPQFLPALADDAPPGWATAPIEFDGPGVGLLRPEYQAIFGGWLATRNAVPAGQGRVELVPAAQQPQAQNALTWAYQRAAEGWYVVTWRPKPSVLAFAAEAQVRSLPSDWVIVARPVTQAQPAPPGFPPSSAGPAPQPPPMPPPPGFPGAPGGPVPAPPPGPLAPPGAPPGGLPGFPGVPPAPGVPASPPASATPAIDALPPAIRQQVLAAAVSGDPLQLDQVATALGQFPAAAAEVRKLAVDARAARRMRAIAEGRLVQVRYGDNPSRWAQWYTGDGNRWRDLLKFNGIGTKQVNGVTQPDPARWKIGAEIELPPDWPGSKGLPPPLGAQARAAAPPAARPAPSASDPLGPSDAAASLNHDRRSGRTVV